MIELKQREAESEILNREEIDLMQEQYEIINEQNQHLEQENQYQHHEQEHKQNDITTPNDAETPAKYDD